jgi:hypothetical protein
MVVSRSAGIVWPEARMHEVTERKRERKREKERERDTHTHTHKTHKTHRQTQRESVYVCMHM